MKNLFLALVLASSWISFTTAYNDISPNAKYNPAITSLLEQNILTDGSFFRSDDGVPAKFFLETLLKSAHVDTSYLEEIRLPPEINRKDPAVPYLRYAISKDLIDGEVFDPLAMMPKDEAVKKMLTMYDLDVRIRSSRKFNKLYAKGLREAGYYPGIFKHVETALNANILDENDVIFFGQPLNRADLVTWIHRFQTEGKKPKNARSNAQNRIQQNKTNIPEYKIRFPYQSRDQTNKQADPSKSKPKISIEMLNNDGSSQASEPADKAANIIRQVMRDLLRNYRFKDQLTEAKQEEMVHSAVAGFLDPLPKNDKYTRYIVPDRVEEFNEALGSEFQGIGAFVSIIDGNFTIEAPIENSPAEKAGLQPGDIVLEVNGESIIGEELRNSIRKVKGPAGSIANLTIRRGSEVKKIAVTRGTIKLESVTFETVQSVPIVKIHKFEKETLPKFLALIENGTLTGDERGIIIDLRNNPGGLLKEALKISQEFVKKDVVVMQYDERDNNQKLIADKDGRLSDIPKIAILQNKGSASASEVLAAMLIEQRDAKVFGQTSVGKGTVQTLRPYGSALLKMTTAKWLTPNGEWIHEKGIPADYEFENQTYQERKAGIDNARDAAINYILGR